MTVNSEKVLTTEARQEAERLYHQGNEYRRHQEWDKALNAYEQAAALDSASPAVAARQMLMEIMEYRCKDYYNP